MGDREDFDRIVEGLDLDLSFVDEPLADHRADEPPQPAARVEPAEDEAFYRQVDAVPIVPRRRGIVLAWAGVIGAPLMLVLATVAHVFLDRPLVAGAVLIFVASAIYLFLQLPEHGPSRRDWPDDGAVL